MNTYQKLKVNKAIYLLKQAEIDVDAIKHIANAIGIKGGVYSEDNMLGALELTQSEAIWEKFSRGQVDAKYVLASYNESIDTDKNLAKKDEIEKIFIDHIKLIGMDIPSNFEDIVQFIYEDVCDTADPLNWSGTDVVIGFRRWIESV